ncbi:MAG: hypothetical protein AAFV53_38980 [Myxococcota bacterium]
MSGHIFTIPFDGIDVTVEYYPPQAETRHMPGYADDFEVREPPACAYLDHLHSDEPEYQQVITECRSQYEDYRMQLNTPPLYDDAP